MLAVACSTSEPEPPVAESDAYLRAVSDFFVSLAAAQTDEARFAFNKMNDVARAWPQEAAAWANLGVMAMRQGNFDLAGTRLGQAREAAPGNADVLWLSGMYYSRRGDLSEAIRYFREAAEASPQNPRIWFSLFTELERQDDSANAEEIVQVLETLKVLQPRNQAVWYESARIANRNRMQPELEDALRKLGELQQGWDADAREQLEMLLGYAEEGDFSEITFELVFLRNMIEPTPVFQDDVLRIQFPPTEVGFLITEFIWLPRPEFRVAEPDLGVHFHAQTPEDFAQAALLKGATLLEEFPPFTVHIADGHLVLDAETRLPFPGRTDVLLHPAVMAEIDFNYNFRNDIALAGDFGFRLYRQEDDRSFTDISATLGLPAALRNDSYFGVWPADVDLDGDLDLILAPKSGPAIALINQSDGSFGRLNLFPQTRNVRDVRWADFNGDGTADGVFLQEDGSLVMYRNLTGNVFVLPEGFPEVNDAAAMAVGDLNANSYFEIVFVTPNGAVDALRYAPRYDRWDRVRLFDAPGNTSPKTPATTTLFVTDVDNNGSLDVVLSTPERTTVLLSDSEFTFRALELPDFGWVTSIYDVNGNERLDLVGTTAAGEAVEWMNAGTKNYNAYSIRARASGGEGDARINTFGIGGEMEIRSGLLYQKQLISSPIVHFGLGTYEEAEMLRIIWPNGSVQAEFAELGLGSTIFNEQVLKGSCPWLFTNDGEEIHFITDLIWRSPLGLRINALETAGVIQTEDRVRIPAGLLQPVDGVYDMRVTAELWETHYFDHLSLIAVDHPVGTELFIDERFVFPAPDLTERLLSVPVPVAAVRDMHDTDLSAIVAQPNGEHIAPFRKTKFQGLVHPHYIEIEVGESVDQGLGEWLVLQGWLRPTDSSINLMLSQSSFDSPSGLMVEVADGSGGWQVLHENYGIPAGKQKSVLMDLTGVFPDESDRRLRLHTTSEIYWDAIRKAARMPDAQMTLRELPAERMELRYRGFSRWNHADSLLPNLPDYAEITSTNQRWRDLEGYYTRFGDVTELLAETDDRYVIMNAGDELVLEYRSPGEPAAGMKRSFILVNVGWVKDGDFNTEAGMTVLPLPYHGQSDYEYVRGGRLQDDPVFQRFPEDWVNFHTRYVTPEAFRSALLLNPDTRRNTP